MRKWMYKTDEAGKPRRFLGHGEAATWSMLTVGKLFGTIAGLMLLNAAVGAYRDGDPWSSLFVPTLAVAWLAIWLPASLALYLYVSLSGGVMDEEARRRYHNNETLSRPR